MKLVVIFTQQVTALTAINRRKPGVSQAGISVLPVAPVGSIASNEVYSVFTGQRKSHYDGCRAGVCHPTQHNRETAL